VLNVCQLKPAAYAKCGRNEPSAGRTMFAQGLAHVGESAMNVSIGAHGKFAIHRNDAHIAQSIEVVELVRPVPACPLAVLLKV